MSEQASTTSGGGEGVPPTVPADVAAALPVEQVIDAVDAKVTEQKEVQSGDQIAKPEATAVDVNANNAEKPEEVTNIEQKIGITSKETPKEVTWQQRETELLKKIEELEKSKNEASAEGLKLELKVREEEIDLLKARVKNLETELQAALSKPGAKNLEMVEKIKQQHDELLGKAKGMIFDKTKIVKNQELQIEALTSQVQSLKDVSNITKDLLEIRNSEVKSLEERLEAMEAKFKAEKERFGLVLKRAETSSHINDDLRKEYETQLGIFKELREKYEKRVQALVVENNKLKELKEAKEGGPSANDGAGGS